MCLYTKSGAKTTDKEIKCYKVLQSVEALQNEVSKKTLQEAVDNGYSFLTPYQYFPMRLGATYTEKKPYFEPYVGKDGIMRISENYIHSFATIEAALESIGYCEMSGAIVVECVIPEGTKYFEGCIDYPETQNDEVHTYASKTLKLTNTIVAKTNNPKEGEVYTLSYDGKEYREIEGIEENGKVSFDKLFAHYWVEVEKAQV